MDAHMNDNNYKKMIGMATALVRKWKKGQVEFKTRDAECAHLRVSLDDETCHGWKVDAQAAQAARNEDVNEMKIFEVRSYIALSRQQVEGELIDKESAQRDNGGLAETIAKGIQLQEEQVAIQGLLRQVINNSTEWIEMKWRH
ncbi:hypothetical protein OF83DRAFT_1176577 [Amylostereum chailletii]|nr:hypothetical protein OF83DRAFT_1176577 [Amylostereum chailletii]